MATTRTWLWQLSYAILGLVFLVSLFLSIAAWGTSLLYLWVAVAIGSIVALMLLSRWLR